MPVENIQELIDLARKGQSVAVLAPEGGLRPEDSKALRAYQWVNLVYPEGLDQNCTNVIGGYIAALADFSIQTARLQQALESQL